MYSENYPLGGNTLEIYDIRREDELSDEIHKISHKKLKQKTMNGAIYLHSNGSLIPKPEIVYKNNPSYFSSPYVMKVWYITDDFKKDDWIMMLTDAIGKGALPLDIKEVGMNMGGLTEKDIEKIWETPR